MEKGRTRKSKENKNEKRTKVGNENKMTSKKIDPIFLNPPPPPAFSLFIIIININIIIIIIFIIIIIIIIIIISRGICDK